MHATPSPVYEAITPFTDQSLKICIQKQKLREEQVKNSKYNTIVLPENADGVCGYHRGCYKYFTAIQKKAVKSKTYKLFSIKFKCLYSMIRIRTNDITKSFLTASTTNLLSEQPVNENQDHVDSNSVILAASSADIIGHNIVEENGMQYINNKIDIRVDMSIIL